MTNQKMIAAGSGVSADPGSKQNAGRNEFRS